MNEPREPRITARRETTAEVGRILDRRWHLNRVLGEGAMGRVFLAQQLSVHRPVAVKVIRPDLVTDTTAISRFLREARILSGLQHPHIVRLIDFGQETATGELYLVMELLAGRSLGDRLEAGERYTLPEILTLVEQVAQALAEAHSRGVIHRDLKPGNLFVDRRDGVGLHLTVFDFGIAKIDEPLMPRLTRTGRINGTPHYIAPEQIRGQATPQTDMYAVGVLLYELLCGSVPHDGNSVMEVLMSHLEREPQSLRERWSVGPVQPAVVDLVDDLLNRDPRKRPASAVDLFERVRSLRLALDLGDDPVVPGPPDTLASWRSDLTGPEPATNDTAPLISMPVTAPLEAPPEVPMDPSTGAMDASMDASMDVSMDVSLAPSPAPVGLGATYDGWEAQPAPSPWKWVGLGLLGLGVLAVVIVGGIHLAGPGPGDLASVPLEAPTVVPAAPAVPEDALSPVEPVLGATGNADGAPATDSSPGRGADEAALAAEDEAALAAEDAVETPPVPTVEPSPTPSAPASSSPKRPRRGDRDKDGDRVRKNRDLGDVLKGMRSP